MKKLRLSIDSLSVEGFEVLSRGVALEGTVMGRDDVSVGVPTGCLATQCYRDTCGAGSCASGTPCMICPKE